MVDKKYFSYWRDKCSQIMTVGKHTSSIVNLKWNGQYLMSQTEKEIVISKGTETDQFTTNQAKYLANKFQIVKWFDTRDIKGELQTQFLLINLLQNKKELMIINLETNKKPLKIKFNDNYGKILNYFYIGKGIIIIAFIKGNLIKINLQNSQIEEEIDNEKIFQNNFYDIKINNITRKIYVSGDNLLKVLNFRKLKELQSLEKGNYKLQISNQGRLMSCFNRKLIIYEMEREQLYYFGQYLIKQSQNCFFINNYQINIDFDIVSVSVYQNQLLICGNDKYQFYHLYQTRFKLIHENEMKNIISSQLKLQILIQTKSNYIFIDKENFNQSEIKLNGKILLDDYYFLQINKNVQQFSLFSQQKIKDFNFGKVDNIFINNNLIVYQNEENSFLYDLSSDKSYPLDVSLIKVYFDKKDILVQTKTGTQLFQFQQNYQENKLKKIRDVQNQKEFKENENQVIFPIKCQIIGYQNGKIISAFNQNYLPCYSYLLNLEEEDEDIINDNFFKSLEVNDFQTALIFSGKNLEFIDLLYIQSIKYFNIHIAIECQRKLKNLNKIIKLQEIQQLTNKLEQKGEISLLLNNDNALQYFQKSNNDKCIDLYIKNKQFTEALKICKNEEKIKEIKIQQAQQMIKQEEFIKAFSLLDEIKNQKSIQLQCLIYLQQQNQNIDKLIQQITQEDLIYEIAIKASQLNYQNLAFNLLNKINYHEEALQQLLLQKKEKEIEDYLQQNINKLHDHDFLNSLLTFFINNNNFQFQELILKKQQNHLDLIKLYLKNNQSKSAELIFNKFLQNSQQGANLLANFYIQQQGNKSKAIQYYLKAGRKQEAFKQAQEEDFIDIFCQHVKELDNNEALQIAYYYENKDQNDNAAKYFVISNNIDRALLNYIYAKSFQKAVDLVVQQKSQPLLDILIQIFAGNPTNLDNEIVNIQAAEPLFLFKLYIQFDQIHQANEIALLIIEKEIEEGKYSIALEKLYQIIKEIQKREKGNLNLEIKNRFYVYHQYKLAKQFIKQQRNYESGSLFNRICNFINFFPNHQVQIMTTAVIQCTKSKQKYFAYKWARELCKPDNRVQISKKVKDKIEKIALKQCKLEFEEKQKCYFCQKQIKLYSSECSECKNELDICMGSGQGILDNQKEIQQCLGCRFYYYSEYLEKDCQVCNGNSFKMVDYKIKKKQKK